MFNGHWPFHRSRTTLTSCRPTLGPQWNHFLHFCYLTLSHLSSATPYWDFSSRFCPVYAHSQFPFCTCRFLPGTVLAKSCTYDDVPFFFQVLTEAGAEPRIQGKWFVEKVLPGGTSQLMGGRSWRSEKQDPPTAAQSWDCQLGLFGQGSALTQGAGVCTTRSPRAQASFHSSRGDIHPRHTQPSLRDQGLWCLITRPHPKEDWRCNSKTHQLGWGGWHPELGTRTGADLVSQGSWKRYGEPRKPLPRGPRI